MRMRGSSPNFDVTPLYLQVFELLFDRISKGEWRPGAALPNEFQLSDELRVSTGTIRKAIELLERDGFVARRKGKGTFVTSPTSNEQRAFFDPLRNADGSRVDWRYIRHSIHVRPSTKEEQVRFGIAPGANIGQINRLRAIGLRPAVISSSFVPSDRFPSLTDLSDPTSIIVSLARSAGIQLGTTEEVVDICPASDEASAALAIPDRHPILRIQRLVRDIEGAPIEASIMQCHLVAEQYRAPVARYRDQILRSDDRFTAACELAEVTSFK